MNAFAPVKIRHALSRPKNMQALVAETGLPERTLRYNLRILKDAGVVRDARILSDNRRKIFFWGG